MIKKLKARITRFIRNQIHETFTHLRETVNDPSKSSALTRLSQIHAANVWANDAEKRSFLDVGFSIHSEFEEDGIILYIFTILGHGTRTVIEIGCGDGIQNNSTNLILNHHWRGLLIDASPTNAATASKFFLNQPQTKLFPPKILCAYVTPSNVNQLLESAGFLGEVDLLSLDIDSVDLWVLEALTAASPRVVIVEINARWSAADSMTTPRDDSQAPVFDPEMGMIFGGASLAAFCKLMDRKGYRLVGSNAMATNCFFMRNDSGVEMFPELSASSVLSRDRAVSINELCASKIREFPWVRYD